MRCLTVVRFPARADLDPARLRRLLEDTVPRYREVPGLRRKYFIGGPTASGGVYEWQSRDAAAAFHDETWRARMQSLYGASPEVEFFDVHALVDNAAGSTEIAG